VAPDIAADAADTAISTDEQIAGPPVLRICRRGAWPSSMVLRLQGEDGETVARHFFGAGLITWLDFERVTDRLFTQSSPDAPDAAVDAGPQRDNPVGCKAPHAVLLGPPTVADGLRVVWIMSFDKWLELGMRSVGPGRRQARDLADVVLDDGAGQIHRPAASTFRDGYGQLRFPHPKVATAQLTIAGEQITLDLAHEARG
jgi:hypothetical protein